MGKKSLELDKQEMFPWLSNFKGIRLAWINIPLSENTEVIPKFLVEPLEIFDYFYLKFSSVIANYWKQTHWHSIICQISFPLVPYDSKYSLKSKVKWRKRILSSLFGFAFEKQKKTKVVTSIVFYCELREGSSRCWAVLIYQHLIRNYGITLSQIK